MKGINSVGFKKSGKTTTLGMLADVLETRGLRLGIAKFTHQGLDMPGTDTAWLMKSSRTVAGLGSEEAAVFWSHKRYLPDLLPLMPADMLLVEGGKQLGWLPRILCLKEPEDAPDLTPELALATYGEISLPGLPHFTPESLDQLATLVEERAFVLPGLDCGECGFTDCAGLAARIVAGKAGVEHCKAKSSGLEITVNGQPVALNSFTADMILGSVKGMLATLKGYAPGSAIEMKFKS